MHVLCCEPLRKKLILFQNVVTASKNGLKLNKNCAAFIVIEDIDSNNILLTERNAVFFSMTFYREESKENFFVLKVLIKRERY